MTLALAIALNVIAAVGLIGFLVYAMTRPARLRPHVPAMTLETEQRLEHAIAARRRSNARVVRPARRPIRTAAAARS